MDVLETLDKIDTLLDNMNIDFDSPLCENSLAMYSAKCREWHSQANLMEQSWQGYATIQTLKEEYKA